MTKRHRSRLLSLAGALLCTFAAASALAQVKAQPAPNTRPAPPPALPPPAPSAADLAGPPAAASRLPSGVATMQLRAGTGTELARPQDFVVFRSIGRRSDGTVVQNGFGSREANRIQISRLGQHWQESLTSMRAGEQRRFWFPASLMPKDPTTGAQEPVVFDVELISLGRLPATPATLRTPDPKATRVGAGTSVLVLQPGKDGPPLGRKDGAMVEFTLWNGDGHVVNSSAIDGRPTLFPLEKVMPSFADCLVGMLPGEKRRCWIPALHNDGFPGALKGDLVFEVDLVGTMDLSKLAGAAAVPPTSKP